MSRQLANLVAWIHTAYAGFQFAILIMMMIGAEGLSKIIDGDELVKLWVTMAATAIFILLSLMASFFLQIASYDVCYTPTRIRLITAWLVIAVLNILFSSAHLIFVSSTVSENVSSSINIGFYIFGAAIVSWFRAEVSTISFTFHIPYRLFLNTGPIELRPNHQDNVQTP